MRNTSVENQCSGDCRCLARKWLGLLLLGNGNGLILKVEILCQEYTDKTACSRVPCRLTHHSLCSEFTCDNPEGIFRLTFFMLVVNYYRLGLRGLYRALCAGEAVIGCDSEQKGSRIYQF